LLDLQLAVTSSLTDAGTPAGAGARMLEQIWRGLELDHGILWWVDRDAQALVRADTRPAAGRSAPRPDLAEAAWRTGAVSWSPEGGVAVPVAAAGRVLGVLECRHASLREPDRVLGELLQAFGRQLGDVVARLESQRAALSTEARRRAVLEAAPDPVISVDGEGRISEFNPAAGVAFGLARDDALGRPVTDLVPERLRERHLDGFRRCLDGAEPGILGRRFESVALRADGSEFPVELTVTRSDPLGSPAFTGYLRDLSGDRRADRAMRDLAAIVESSQDAILSTTLDGVILTWNRGAESLYGYTSQEAVGRSVAMLAASGQVEEMSRTIERVRAGESETQVDVLRRRKDGSTVDVELTVSPVVGGDGGIVGASVIARDMTLQRRAQEQIAYLAFHDQLTGLPNRSLFYQHLELAIARADRGRLGVAVLFVDLDNFKLINDSFGHLAGDALLQDFATRLRAVTRATDTVARQGGDEFLVLVPDLELSSGPGIEPNALEVVQSIEAKVRSVLETPFDVAGTPIHVGLSVGVSIYPIDARDRDQLLRNADTAMYVGKGLADDASPGLEQAGSRGRLALIGRLRGAVEHDQFELRYQPIVELASGNMVGAEALLRWRDPVRGLVAPGEFIPLAERSGMIKPITHWVIEHACRQAREWSDHALDLVVTFNLPPSLWGPEIIETLIAATHRAGVEPHRMMIEITESTAMVQPGRARQTLDALREHGVRLAIDDFGTGYSSLGRLHQLPVSTLKIDRSFVHALPHDAGAAAIVDTIIQLSHSLGVQPLAEGIESEQQLRFLIEHGCDLGQGFLLGRPMVADRIEALAY
jgi:diguanylate cyclase (GGDEF)-like protein/PAS domain S-box-containing protein